MMTKNNMFHKPKRLVLGLAVGLEFMGCWVWFLHVIGEKNVFSIVFRNFLCFVLHFVFGIYNKFVKFLKDLTTISITLKNLIPEN